MSRVTATKSGAIATIKAPGSVPIRRLRVIFTPKQSGSGDPSPSNVRPITGWTGVEVYHSGADTSNPTTLPITFPSESGTVYGGYVDLVTGELKVEWVEQEITSERTFSQWGSTGTTSKAFRTDSPRPLSPKAYYVDGNRNVICDVLRRASNVEIYNGTDYGACINNDGGLAIRIDGVETVEDLETWLESNPLTIAYKLATPVSYTLTPTQLSTLIGVNNIWSDGDSVEVEYDLAESAEMLEIRKRIMSAWKPFWQSVLTNVRAGKAAQKYPIGTELMSTYTYNGVTYDCPWVVLDNDRECEWEDGTKHPGLWLGMKYATPEDVQFDAAENNVVDLTEEPNALDGWYYWGVTGTTYTKINVNTGDALPTTYDSVRKCSINNVDVLKNGYNRWKDSGQRQWLNSDAGIGEWWTAQHPGDVAPSQLASIPGFMTRLDSEFLQVVHPVKVKTSCNTVTDGGVTDTTVDTFFLQSLEEVYGSPQIEDIEGPYFPYWKIATGLDQPTNGSSSNTNNARKIKRVNSPTGSAAGVRLRSANRGYSRNAWYVHSSGYLFGNYSAYDSYAALPACVIS